MVLAAGLGTRMRPLTDDRPKALVEVGGRALIDHVLDRLVAAGVTRAVVNVHWFADRLESHLAARDDLEIVISDERAELLETGGGLKKARALLGDDPVWVANIDSVWIDRGDALGDLARLWNPQAMDVALLLAQPEGAIGWPGKGDGFVDDDGRFRFRGDDRRPRWPIWACTSPGHGWSMTGRTGRFRCRPSGDGWRMKAGCSRQSWMATGCTSAILRRSRRPKPG